MRAWLLCLAACSGSQHAERPASSPPADAARADAPPPIDAGPPADAFVTNLIPPDAPTGGGRVVVVTSDGGECGLMILDRIYFAPGSSEIQPHQQQMAESVAAALACTLKDGSITKLEIQGHSDDKERDGLRVSEERAVRVANLLTAKGVPAKILVVTGYGPTQPLDKRKTAAARAKNRRVDFLILERKQADGS